MMVARNLKDVESIKEAARRVGVEAHIKEVRKQRNGLSSVRFNLRPIKGSNKYYRVGHTGRKIHAVCLHGHRAFFEELFALEPQAHIISSLAKVNPQNLMAVYNRLYDLNIGSIISPFYFGYACVCYSESNSEE